MPVNRGQGQQSTRWYKLCFVPTGDSSDDSDTESVVLAPSTSTQTSTWQELSPPHPTLPPPPNPEPQIRWPLPPPPPLPPFLTESPPLPPLQAWAASFDIESQHGGIHEPPSPSGAFLDHDPFASPSVVEQGWPEADDQIECLLEVPDGIINAIRRVRITELHERDELSHCPICMEEFKVGDQALQLPCNHTYRSECILRWLNSSKTCPVCRLQLDGWEVQGGSDSSIGDNSLDPPQPPIPPRSAGPAWDYFFPSFPGSQVSEDNSAGDNSDESNHDSVCYDLSDDRLYPRPLIPPPPPFSTVSTRDLLSFTDSAGENSDEANYDSACEDDLGDFHEDGDIVGNYQSDHGSQIGPSVL